VDGVGAGVPWVAPVPVDDVGPGCERVVDGFLREPVSAWSSLAFVVAGVVIVLLSRRRHAASGAAGDAGATAPSSVSFAVLVAGIDVGSVVQHGPNPFWADLAHDLPLLATLAFITADAVADLAGRARLWWWWALPTALLAPVIHWWPDTGDRTQGVVAVAAVVTNSYRALRRPALRRPVVWTLALLAAGGVIQLLSSPDRPLCDPATSWWYGHAAWHVFVAAGLAALSGALGARSTFPGAHRVVASSLSDRADACRGERV
jgi:hypothetical protein